jgi:hypothetical protein
MQVAPLADQARGVALLNAGVVPSLVTTNGAVAGTGSCSYGPLARSADLAYATSSAWIGGYGGGTTLATLVDGCSTVNPQYPAVTNVGVSGGTQFLQSTCLMGFMYPGVYEDLGSLTPTYCSFPHDLIVAGPGTYTAIDTSTYDGNDHLLLYNGLNYAADYAVSSGATVAAAGTLVSEAARSDAVYIEELPAGRLWAFARPGNTVTGFQTLPSGYAYVNSSLKTSIAFSARTMAIGADGLAYIAVNSSYNGLMAVEPSTGALVAMIPNPSPVTGSPPYSVTSDARGTIYWTAGGYLMHYPNNIP